MPPPRQDTQDTQDSRDTRAAKMAKAPGILVLRNLRLDYAGHKWYDMSKSWNEELLHDTQHDSAEV